VIKNNIFRFGWSNPLRTFFFHQFSKHKSGFSTFYVHFMVERVCLIGDEMTEGHAVITVGIVLCAIHYNLFIPISVKTNFLNLFVLDQSQKYIAGCCKLIEKVNCLVCDIKMLNIALPYDLSRFGTQIVLYDVGFHLQFCNTKCH